MPTDIRINNFILYGLNRYRNFLFGEALLSLCDEDDVKEFCASVLHEYPFSNTAIFCVFNDGMMLAVIKVSDDGERGKYKFVAAKDMHFFAMLDGEFLFDTYALICEITPGNWVVQE